MKDNLEGEAEEALVQITGFPSKGYATENGETKMVRASQRWFYDLQVIEILMRGNDPPLQHVCTIQLSLARYELGDTSKGGFEVDHPCSRK